MTQSTIWDRCRREYLVEFYDKALPRQVSSAATLEYFTRHLSDTGRAALTLRPEDIFARVPDAQLLALYPERIALPALSVPVEYRFAPGEARDGATLMVPLLALPTLSRSAVDAAVPGLAAPRVEALLRSLPKDARRSLIPIGAAAAGFLENMGAPSTDPQRLAVWLRESRGIPAALIRFDLAAVPAHLTPQLAVVDEDRELAQGNDLVLLRRRCAAQARAELERRADATYPAPWRRFETELPETAAIGVGDGVVTVYPTLARHGESLRVRFEWTADEAQQTWRQAATFLARALLPGQGRELAKKIASDSPLLLAASPYLRGDELIDGLLTLVFRRACFADEDPPRTRAQFEAAVDRGRALLYPALSDVTASALNWFVEARAVRRLLDDPRARSQAASALESRAHLSRLLGADSVAALPANWLRQLPRYLKAEQRRWERLLARGSEPPQIQQEIEEWNARLDNLQAQVAAELRWNAELDELRWWTEEYRVSLYAQELKTVGPVSAVRLAARAAQVEAWITR